MCVTPQEETCLQGIDERVKEKIGKSILWVWNFLARKSYAFTIPFLYPSALYVVLLCLFIKWVGAVISIGVPWIENSK